MATTKLAGNPVQLAGEFPEKQSIVKGLTAVKSDLSPLSLDDYKGKRKILNIFPSIDTDVCAVSVRTFNTKAASLENTHVICLSFDLPFAHKRFCGAEGIENVTTASLFRTPEVAKDLGVLIETGPLAGLTARAVIVLDENNTVLHAQMVEDIKNEPDYDAALAVL
ncbi:MAG: thiol peroxidase [Proteobacteria bacterium]|nr:thiol peroxidase [Pseudomonadota bacterium]MBU1388199.1 thiol peroxidase [Pseudomonadota bacterium]MBU1543011.1 thiol peroxidase [Pseudomonadota bacterium]MBU2431755.1 thiol peroxidase [Pseudomonadota bacterium]MBU2480498.1 thiol peroxidase [Pseudomonadota bacterium]